MGAVEHLKTLCCLGLKPESAMAAVTPLLHEIIPHGWSRLALLAPDSAITSTYAENPGMEPLLRERLWHFMDDPSALVSLWIPAFKAAAIGWSLHKQGPGYLESGYYREIEAPLDSCWILSAMIGDGTGSGSIAHVGLSRPRSARPFTVDDIQRLDHLRPWLAHAFRRSPSADMPIGNEVPLSTPGATLLSGQLIATPDSRLVYQTPSLDHLLRILAGEPSNYTHHVPTPDSMPAPILKLLRQITGVAAGTSNAPPRMQVSTAYGVLTLEAKWLLPAGMLPSDATKDPNACLIAVTIELYENPVAHAARVLRESGATPSQTKVGIQLAFGKSKPAIADEFGIQLTSVADLTKKLYQTLDVHNSAELGTKIWLGQKQKEAERLRRQRAPA
ncbi:MAG TPA: hypothetical protein VL996_01520 [Methylocella sp.]|nr:hypothetical protein [Methylocella sp.]